LVAAGVLLWSDVLPVVPVVLLCATAKAADSASTLIP
jgi:hypothetical protein